MIKLNHHLKSVDLVEVSRSVVESSKMVPSRSKYDHFEFSEKTSINEGKQKFIIFRCRRVHFRRFDNRSTDLDEIYRSKVLIRFHHISSSKGRKLTKSTKSESWESGEPDFEDARSWGFVYREIWRFRNSLGNDVNAGKLQSKIMKYLKKRVSMKNYGQNWGDPSN